MEALKDLLAGAIGGSAGIAVGQPFDTVKTRMQTQPAVYSSLSSTIKTTFQADGVAGFFKGIIPPVVGNAFICCLLFGTYGPAFRYLTHESSPWKLAPIPAAFVAGVSAGGVMSIVEIPATVLKCRQQIHTSTSGTMPLSTWALVRNIVRRNGFPGLYRGGWYVNALPVTAGPTVSSFP